ncbi:efflux transporter outer membrane subunit [Roseateles sp. MS654]|uniref:efflux transporter outer membrane subunit n=1 Tax=Roseateles sp. MS654 TaxID=3412685 RepID=UPI003C2C543F
MKSLALVAVMALSACTMTPALVRPDPQIPIVYPHSVPVRGAVQAADIGWREMFSDARLQRLIEMALTNNRDLRLAALNVQAVQAQFNIQQAAQLPAVDAGLSGSRSRTRDSGSAVTASQFGTSIRVTAFELDLFGRVSAQTEAAFSRYLASEQGRRAAQIALVGAVADSYFAERLAREQFDLAEKTVRDWQSSADLARRLKDANQTGALELAQALAQVATAEADLEARKRARDLAHNALAVLIGQQVPADLPPGTSLMDGGVITQLPAGLPSQMLIRRPDLQQAEMSLVAANAEIGAARAAFFPSISLTASVGTASSDIGQLFKAGHGVWSFAPQITQPLFNAGKLKAELRLAELRKSSALLEYERAVQIAFREVADGLAGSESFARQAEAQRRAVQGAERRAALAEMRHRAGVDSRLELLDAQRQLYAAKQAVLDLRRAELGNAIALYKALGGGLKESTQPG